MNLLETIQKMRAIGAPILAVETADQMTTIAQLRTALNGETPLILWDCVNGLQALNNRATDALTLALSGVAPGAPGQPPAHSHPTRALVMMTKLPEDSIVLFVNGGRFLGDAGVLQAVMNLRDQFKSNNRVLVLFGVNFKLPAELQADVLTIDDPLPTPESVGQIARKVFEDAARENKITIDTSDGMISKATDALRGLAGFAVEQAAAMSLGNNGAVDVDSLWQRKKSAVEETDGLSFKQPKLGFEVVGGNQFWKDFVLALKENPEARPRLIVRIDEMEKQLAGAGGDNSIGDTSGVSQDQHQTALKEMENHGYIGVINYGMAGCSKSWIAEAAAAEFACPMIELDFGAMKGSLVGESEGKIRRAFKVLHAIGGDGHGVYFIATVNSMVNLSGPLMRRFADGVYYFDLPDGGERAAIGAIQAKLWNVKDDEPFWLLDCEGWSGANIRDCCRLAFRLRCSVKQASKRIVAAGTQNPQLRDQLRDSAHGKYLSANRAGVYQKPGTEATEKPVLSRKLSLK